MKEGLPVSPPSTSLKLARLSFVQPDSFSNLPISSIAQHPTAPLLAVSRAGGHIELWTYPTTSERDRKTNAPPLLSSATSGSSIQAQQHGNNWFLISSIRSCGVSSLSPSSSSPSSSFPVHIQHLCWVSSPIFPSSSSSSSSKSVPRSHDNVIEGARLLVGTLSGQVLEADFTGLRLLHAADSNAGAIWAMEAFDLRRAGCGPRGGSILALGCEDGSVRLFRVHTHSGLTIERMSRCSGTDGRVLSVAWHSHSPILCAGTAGGTLRCWDCTPLIADEVLARNKVVEKKTRDKEKIVKMNSSVKVNSSVSSVTFTKRTSDVDFEKSDDDDDDDDEEDEDKEKEDLKDNRASLRQGKEKGQVLSYTGQSQSVTPKPIFRIQVDPQQIGRKGSNNNGGGKDSKPVKVTMVWCVSVLSDMTVITGDSNGDVLAWDGKLGVAAHSAPIVRLEGAVLSLSAFEDEPGAHVTIAAGGLEGRVSVVTRSSPYFNNDDKSESLSVQQQRWSLVASHRSHVADVCAISLHRSSLLSNGSEISVVSAASDGRLCISTLSSHLTSVSVPRFISSSWQGPSQLVSLSSASSAAGNGIGPLVAFFNSTGTALQVWKVEDEESKISLSEHLLQINIPRISPSLGGGKQIVDETSKRKIQLASRLSKTGTEKTSQLSALELEGDAPNEIPLNGFPSAVSISNDGQWLCYSVGGGRVPPALFSLVSADQKTSIDGISPVFVNLPSSILSLFGSKSSSSVSLLQLVNISTSSALLVIVIGLRIYVCLCSRAMKDGNKLSECTVLYSLPIPRGISEPLTVVAGRSRKRARSSTSDSLSHLEQAKSPSFRIRDEETENDDIALEGDVVLSSQPGPMSAGAVMPILISTSPVIDGIVSLLIATSSRHVHVFKLSETRGSLIVTLPRLISLPTALCFAPIASEQQHQQQSTGQVYLKASTVSRSPQNNVSSFAICAALRSGSIEFFSADSGRLLPWSPEATSIYPNAFLTSCQASPVRSLIPLNNCPGELSTEFSRTAPFKLVAISATTLTPLVYTFNSKAASQATPVSSHRTVITCSSQSSFPSGLRNAGIFNSSLITEGRDQTARVTVAVVEDTFAESSLSQRAVHVKKKKYGKV
jgi:hypothetical protein